MTATRLAGFLVVPNHPVPIAEAVDRLLREHGPDTLTHAEPGPGRKTTVTARLPT